MITESAFHQLGIYPSLGSLERTPCIGLLPFVYKSISGICGGSKATDHGDTSHSHDSLVGDFELRW